MATLTITPITHSQTNDDTIKHNQTHKSNLHNQQKPTKAQPTKTHITNSRSTVGEQTHNLTGTNQSTIKTK